MADNVASTSNLSTVTLSDPQFDTTSTSWPVIDYLFVAQSNICLESTVNTSSPGFDVITMLLPRCQPQNVNPPCNTACLLYSCYLLLLILKTPNCQSHQYSFLLLLQLLVIQKVPKHCYYYLASFPHLPTIQFCILQAIKNWTVGRLGNEANYTLAYLQIQRQPLPMTKTAG